MSAAISSQHATCNKRQAVSQQPVAENMFSCMPQEARATRRQTSSRTVSPASSAQPVVRLLVLQNSNVASQPIALAVVEVAAAADAALWKIWHKEPKSNTK